MYHEAAHPSRLVLPVIPAGAGRARRGGAPWSDGTLPVADLRAAVRWSRSAITWTGRCSPSRRRSSPPNIKLSNSDIAAIANSFLAAYTVGQLFAGVFVDRLGARTGMTLAVVAWSLTAMATGLARRVGAFCSFRFLLGLSESVNYPAGVKVAAEWFPPKELATAVGIFQSGSSVGAMIAPPRGGVADYAVRLEGGVS